MVSVAMTARAPRQPRRRASRDRRSRSPGRQDDDGPEPPPALAGKRYALTCEAPAGNLSPLRGRTPAPVAPAAASGSSGWLAGIDADLLRLGDLARGLVSTGQLEPVAALSLVIWPTDRVRQALRVTA